MAVSVLLEYANLLCLYLEEKNNEKVFIFI